MTNLNQLPEHTDNYQWSLRAVTVLVENGHELGSLQAFHNVANTHYQGLKAEFDIVYNPAREGSKIIGWYISGISERGALAVASIAKAHSLTVNRLTIGVHFFYSSVDTFHELVAYIKKWFKQHKPRTKVSDTAYGVLFGARNSSLSLELSRLYDHETGYFIIATCRGEYAQVAWSMISKTPENGFTGVARAGAAAFHTMTKPGLLIPGFPEDTLKLPVSLATTSKPVEPPTFDDYICQVAAALAEHARVTGASEAELHHWTDDIFFIAWETYKEGSQKVPLANQTG